MTDISLIKDRISALTDSVEMGLEPNELVKSLIELAELHRTILNNRDALNYLTQSVEVMDEHHISGKPRYDAEMGLSRLLAIRESKESLSKALGHADLAIEVAKSGLNLDDQLTALLNKASLLNMMDRLDESEQVYREVLRILPIEKKGIKEYRHLIFANMGVLSGKRGNIEKAETLLEQAVEVAPDSDPVRKADIIKSLARAYYMRDDFEGSKKLLDKALTLAKSQNADIQVIVRILMDIENTSKAMDDHKTAYESLVERADWEKKWTDKQVEFQMVATQVRHDLLDAKRQKEIFRLENVELVRLNTEISEQKAHIEHVNKEIVDSINYASRLQKAFIPGATRLRAEVPKSFAIEMAKDRVSGDFTWTHLKDGLLYVAVADCTGHGVPGAMITVLGNQLLTDSIEMDGLRHPSEILIRVCLRIREMLTRTGNSEITKDGMDMGLLVLDRANSKYTFCGAKRPLWLFINGELQEIKTGRMSVSTETPPDHIYEVEEGTFSPGMRFFLHSDGYCDQFGGPLNKKFQAQRLRDLILLHANDDMATNEVAMRNAIVSWKEGYEQTDDITLIGIEM